MLPLPTTPLARQVAEDARPLYLAALARFAAAPETDAMQWLEDEVAFEWSRLYKARVTYKTMIDAVTFRGCTFVYDSAGGLDPNLPGRVVAAFARSRPYRTVRQALEELASAVTAGRATNAAVANLETALNDQTDAGSGRLLARQREAAVAALGLTERPLSWFAGEIIAFRSGGRATPKVIADLGRVEALLTGSTTPGDALALGEGAKIDAADLRSLSRRAADADAALPAAERTRRASELIAFLGRSPIVRLLNELRERPSPELVHRTATHLLPIFPDRRRRPRRTYAQRHYRGFEPAGIPQGAMDIGHYLAHANGGPADVNFFRQDRRLNRGWSEEGRRYRAMEACAARWPGTVVFSRPIYTDLTDVPALLEYGLLLDPAAATEVEERHGVELLRDPSAGPTGRAWWIEVFDNRPGA